MRHRVQEKVFAPEDLVLGTTKEGELEVMLDTSSMVQVIPSYTERMDYIHQKKAMMIAADITGKYNQNSAGFSPSRKWRLIGEMPCEDHAIAQGLSPDVFTNKNHTDQFLKDHSRFDMRIKR